MAVLSNKEGESTPSYLSGTHPANKQVHKLNGHNCVQFLRQFFVLSRNYTHRTRYASQRPAEVCLPSSTYLLSIPA
jgi:hypothetical protein